MCVSSQVFLWFSDLPVGLLAWVTDAFVIPVYLLQACVPYFEILEKWIYKGMIRDPYSEVLCFVLIKWSLSRLLVKNSP